MGDEKHFGEPQLQKAMALFKKVPKEATYEDLIGQDNPQDEPQLLEEDPLARDICDDVHMEDDEGRGLSPGYASLRNQAGWHVDSLGNPVLVSHKVWALRTPESRYAPDRFPFSTSWAYADGQWKRLEHEVKWMELDDHRQLIPEGPASMLITIFQTALARTAFLMTFQ